jgi:hypothetical protein
MASRPMTGGLDLRSASTSIIQIQRALGTSSLMFKVPKIHCLIIGQLQPSRRLEKHGLLVCVVSRRRSPPKDLLEGRRTS